MGVCLGGGVEVAEATDLVCGLYPPVGAVPLGRVNEETGVGGDACPGAGTGGDACA
jgi:hypothetical protein